MFNNGISISIINKREELLKNETKRVRWYLDKYNVYAAQGYLPRFPRLIDPRNCTNISESEIQRIVDTELDTDINDYHAYAVLFNEVWNLVKDKCIPVAREVYGFKPASHFTIMPTAYGMNGGQLVWDGPIYFRLPKYRNVNFRKTEKELIAHEILAHGATAKLRNNTSIDESNPKATHQWHKERLMDLLTRTFLVRSGLMQFSDVQMQEKAQQIAADDVDPLYYIDYQLPDENKLKYEGRFTQFVKDLDLKLKYTNFTS